MMLSSLVGSWDVMAAGIEAPTINKVFYDAKTISGGNVHRQRVSGKVERGTIHVTLKNGNTVKAELSVTPKSGTTWIVNLPENVKVAEGDVVTAYQEYKGSKSGTVTANAEPSMAYNHKNDLKMPSGDFYIEQYVANIVNEDEKAEAIQMLKDVNPSIVNDIESVEFKITGIESSKVATYVVNYTDNSNTGEIKAENLQIVPVTEYSKKYKLDPYNVVSQKITGKVEGDGPFDDVKVQIILSLSSEVEASYCEKGKCKTDKDTSDPINLKVDKTTGKFEYEVKDKDLEIGKKLGIIVKEPHKFKSCNSSVTELAVPKVDVKDPKKLKPEEKIAIADAIRKANTTASGISKLPNGTGQWDGVPAVIQVDDSGNVKIFSGNDVAGTWDPNNGYKFVPETNEDGSYKINDGAKSKTTLNKPDELLSNLAPDTPKMENVKGNVVVTPNITVDTDAKKVVIEYEGADGSKKTITATKTDTGWTVDNDKAKVDENGVVTIPTKEIKTGTKVIASVEDDGGLVPEEKALDSGKAELLIENKYKVTYDANGGEGTMADQEAEAGKQYTILDNAFTAPKDKEFDHWMIGFEPKKPGETTEVNSDVTIKAIWKYIINPTASEVETVVGHPVDYDMYKKAIKDFPAALTVEHIEVKKAPDISTVGGTKATIEVRFSDGQFRTIPVTVNVKADPKDAKIEELNKEVEKLNNQITEKDTKITELNGKITKLENQLKTCKEQCAADKAACEAKKAELQEQINTLAKEKSNLEIQVKENRELIEQLRKEITGLEKQVEDWKKIAGDKDTKIKELENSIKELNTKLDTANTANTELKEKLAAANQKITDLEAKVKELEGKVTELEGKIKELGNTIKSKDAEIKTLNETIATLKEKVATLETEKTKDKEAYEKAKAELQEKLDKANKDLADKNTELDNIKKELEQAKKDLAAEQAKNAGLEADKKAKEEKIADLEAQLKALQEKLNTADTDLKAAKEKIADLDKELAAKDADNKNLTAQVEKLGKDLEAKTTEVNNLNAKIIELEKQVSEKTAQGVADAKEIERLKAELEELKNKLQTKSDEADKLSKEIVTLKETVKTLEGEKTELTNNVTRLETEVKDLKEKLETANKKIIELEKENSTLTERLKNKEEENKKLAEQNEALTKAKETLAKEKEEINNQLTQAEQDKKKLSDEKTALQEEIDKLKEQLKACPADATDQINKLKEKIADLEKQINEKKKDIAAKDAKIEELSNKLMGANSEIADLNKKLRDLASQPREKEYIYIRDNYTPSYNGDVYSLNLEIEALRRENRELKDKIAKLSQGQDCSLMAKERFVTIFSLKSMLYKTYLGDELMTQAEMMDLKGFIEPFISNNRTMLPLRYVALSLGLDVDWNHSTRTATFTNRDSSNALNPGKITINANTLEMKDQYGNKIAVDSKPMLKNGRFYISITNLTKAFGGTNGNLADGIRNTIEWDSQGRRVLVYKYSK